jgi:hypothetical protein
MVVCPLLVTVECNNLLSLLLEKSLHCNYFLLVTGEASGLSALLSPPRATSAVIERFVALQNETLILPVEKESPVKDAFDHSERRVDW